MLGVPMEGILVAAVVAALSLVWAIAASRATGAAKARVATLEAELRSSGEKASSLEARVHELEEENARLRLPPPKPEPEPVKAEPAPEPVKAAPAPEPAKPAPAPAPKPPEDARARVRKQAAAMIREAHEMARFLDFDAQVERNVYRLTLDIRPAVRAEAARFLTEEPFACIKKLDIQGDQALLHIDVAVPPPSA